MQFLATTQSQLNRFDWPSSVLHKIFAIRSTLAWQQLGNGPDAEVARRRLHRRSYEAQDPDFTPHLDADARRVLRTRPEKKKALQSWVQKRLDDLVARNHLVRAFKAVRIFAPRLRCRLTCSAARLYGDP